MISHSEVEWPELLDLQRGWFRKMGTGFEETLVFGWWLELFTAFLSSQKSANVTIMIGTCAFVKVKYMIYVVSARSVTRPQTCAFK